MSVDVPLMVSEYRVECGLSDGRLLVGTWRLAWTPEEFARWRIHKSPAGALPPWRTSEPPAQVLAGPDGHAPEQWEARWWVWPPNSGVPCMLTSTHAAALRYAVESRG